MICKITFVHMGILWNLYRFVPLRDRYLLWQTFMNWNTTCKTGLTAAVAFQTALFQLTCLQILKMQILKLFVWTVIQFYMYIYMTDKMVVRTLQISLLPLIYPKFLVTINVIFWCCSSGILHANADGSHMTTNYDIKSLSNKRSFERCQNMYRNLTLETLARCK